MLDERAFMYDAGRLFLMCVNIYFAAIVCL